MSRIISRAETWQRTYDAFQNINFAAFDFRTVKSSLLDYIKLYFPESFNDFIETSEFIAIVETFAYIAEILAYRIDLAAHENFITVAQRKDSILRLAKLVSYSASRPIAARGLVKLVSVSTSETVVDPNGIDLANKVIRWNDSTNNNWKDQFILVINRVFEQQFGTVGPRDRFQIQDVLFEMYSWNLVPLPTGVIPYTANVGGRNIAMELVPIEYDSNAGITERRPQLNSNFTLLYGQDGLGDQSMTTGFFCYTKQGTLQRTRTSFDGITPNQTFDINAVNINETDVWLNQVDPDSNQIIDTPPEEQLRPKIEGKSGEWVQVDLAHSQNVIFNTIPNRNKYEVETRANNSIRLIFGDGDFADIPSGVFDIWSRVSLDEDIVIAQSAVSNIKSSFTYVDFFGQTQTFTFTYTLVNTLQNGSAAEDIEHIRATAPSVYNTQDRMVNGEDYNSFMLQDPSIAKLTSINRTFAGSSKYITWHDSSGSYENVKMFSDDGALYLKTINDSNQTPIVSNQVLINQYIEPLLSSPQLFLNIFQAGVPYQFYRRTFNSDERDRITEVLSDNMLNYVDFYYNTATYQWYPIRTSDQLSTLPGSLSNYIDIPLILLRQIAANEKSYYLTLSTKQFVMYSETTAFWDTEQDNSTIDYDTINSAKDKIIVLQANINSNRDKILSENVDFDVVAIDTISSGIDAGLPNISQVLIVPTDNDNDGVPDNSSIEQYYNSKGVAEILMPKIVVDVSDISLPTQSPINQGKLITLPVSFIVDPSQYVTTPDNVTAFVTPDVKVYGGNTEDNITYLLQQGIDWIATSSPDQFAIDYDSSNFVINTILLLRNKENTSYGTTIAPINFVVVKVNEYVYFTRVTKSDSWMLVDSSPDQLQQFVDQVNSFLIADQTEPSGYRRLTIREADQQLNDQFEKTRLSIRYQGRSQLNFAWFHHTPRYHLIDPSPTNIIDTYIITKGYFNSFKRWLEDSQAVYPNPPLPLELRQSYNYLLENKMISDTVVLRPGKFKVIFGKKAVGPLQLTFKVIRSDDRTITDNQIKTTIVTTIRNFFNLALWEFGSTFYFSELAAAVHIALPNEISSIIPVPTYKDNQFGDLFQIFAREDEVFIPDITVNDIEIVSGYTPTNMRLNG